MSNQKTPQPDDFMTRIQKAARRGAEEGYRLVLADLKSRKPAR